MKIDCQAYGCTECCRRYWIQVLPSEARKTAEALNETEKEFLENHCLLQIQLFPAPQGKKGGLIIPKENLPEQLLKKIKKELNSDSFPTFFLALPAIVLKREGTGACSFLDQKGLCGIHSSRPKACQLFPFIPHQGKKLHELYPFCAYVMDKKPDGKYLNYGKSHFEKTADYFNEVEKKGFQAVWKAIPSNGIARLDEKLIGKISAKQFFEIMRR